MKKEDLNVITKKNEILNEAKYLKYTVTDNQISNNPYPVLYINDLPVYEGEKVLFVDKKIKNISIREIFYPTRLLFLKDPTLHEQFYLNIKEADVYLKNLVLEEL